MHVSKYGTGRNCLLILFRSARAQFFFELHSPDVLFFSLLIPPSNPYSSFCIKMPLILFSPTSLLPCRIIRCGSHSWHSYINLHATIRELEKRKRLSVFPLLSRREALLFHYHTTTVRGDLEGAFGGSAVIVIFWWAFLRHFDI